MLISRFFKFLALTNYDSTNIFHIISYCTTLPEYIPNMGYWNKHISVIYGWVTNYFKSLWLYTIYTVVIYYFSWFLWVKYSNRAQWGWLVSVLWCLRPQLQDPKSRAQIYLMVVANCQLQAWPTLSVEYPLMTSLCHLDFFTTWWQGFPEQACQDREKVRRKPYCLLQPSFKSHTSSLSLHCKG